MGLAAHNLRRRVKALEEARDRGEDISGSPLIHLVQGKKPPTGHEVARIHLQRQAQRKAAEIRGEEAPTSLTQDHLIQAIPPAMRELLFRGGIEDLNDTAFMSDAELLAIKGLGQRKLEVLRGIVGRRE
jgi:hypothetical protein